MCCVFVVLSGGWVGVQVYEVSSESGSLGNPELRALLSLDPEPPQATADAMVPLEAPSTPKGPVLDPRALTKKRPAAAVANPEPASPFRLRSKTKVPLKKKPAEPSVKKAKPSGIEAAREYRRVYSAAYAQALKNPQFSDLGEEERKAKARQAGKAATSK